MFEQGRNLLRQWFDSVESQLHAESKRAGIFEHSVITGNAREELVRKVLRELLPPQVHVGTGRVIGADCEPSKQIDVVVFDGRFPVLRMGDDALYPVEGVIATIEVKSELCELELRRALANAVSVMRISPSYLKEDADNWIARRMHTGATREQAFDELQWHLIPRTYVFAFDGLRSKTSQSAALQNCLPAAFCATSTRPLMPSVIVGGAAVTVAHGHAISLRLPNSEEQHEIDQKAIAITFESQARFGILASHLLSHLEQRTMMLESSETIRRTVQSYLPFLEYINDQIGDSEYSVTLWHERTLQKSSIDLLPPM